MNYCYIGGSIIPTDEAKVSVTDIGLLRGFGIYEGIKVYGDRPFMLPEHLARFHRSAEGLGLVVPETDEAIEKAIVQLAKKNMYKETAIRMILTGGHTELGIEFNPAHPTFYILAEECVPFGEKYYREGGSLITEEYFRLMPEFKTINYLKGVVLQKKRKDAGALEILYTWQGRVLEAATSNFFIVKNNTVITANEDILLGVTRLAILRLVEGKYKVEERTVLVSELSGADEAFVTGSYKEVVPIIAIDGKTIGDGKVGPVTKEIMALFKGLTGN